MPVADLFQVLAGFAIFATVVLTYGHVFVVRRRGGRKWPSGHPWSGLTLTILGTLSLRAGFGIWQFKPVGKGLAVCAVLSAIFWLIDALIQCGRDRRRFSADSIR